MLCRVLQFPLLARLFFCSFSSHHRPYCPGRPAEQGKSYRRSCKYPVKPGVAVGFYFPFHLDLPFLFVCFSQVSLNLFVPAILCVRFVLWNRDPFLLWFRIVIVVACHFFPFPKAHLARHSIYIGCLDLPWSDICFIFCWYLAGPECRLRQALVLPLCAQLTAALCAVLYRCAAMRADGALPVSFCTFQPPFIPRLRTPYHV